MPWKQTLPLTLPPAPLETVTNKGSLVPTVVWERSHITTAILLAPGAVLRVLSTDMRPWWLVLRCRSDIGRKADSFPTGRRACRGKAPSYHSLVKHLNRLTTHRSCGVHLQCTQWR
ncbi:hypothetical protein K458DRAFT_120990 [Lentithecium fluviatile CBS 122367]|uniref:Uncharacterized protein n=1 Tax=Lentithecium fluviatile CBS 122367 TaxID=1168545 RepID=A0A6G1IMD2_9PLEO|nr:hypothetical protein K458DRAFT_120990 [Lentithecium fluviatile CBS 122367]